MPRRVRAVTRAGKAGGSENGLYRAHAPSAASPSKTWSTAGSSVLLRPGMNAGGSYGRRGREPKRAG